MSMRKRPEFIFGFPTDTCSAVSMISKYERGLSTSNFAFQIPTLLFGPRVIISNRAFLARLLWPFVIFREEPRRPGRRSCCILRIPHSIPVAILIPPVFLVHYEPRDRPSALYVVAFVTIEDLLGVWALCVGKWEGAIVVEVLPGDVPAGTCVLQ